MMAFVICSLSPVVLQRYSGVTKMKLCSLPKVDTDWLIKMLHVGMGYKSPIVKVQIVDCVAEAVNL